MPSPKRHKFSRRNNADTGTPTGKGSNLIEGDEGKLKRRWLFRLVMAALTAGFLFAVASATAAEQGDKPLKVGKKAAFSFTTQQTFGGFTLPAGQYSFRHFEAGDGHAVLFSDEKGMRSVQPGGVRCRLEPLSRVASQTAITTVDENGMRRITQIVIRGENVAHVFN